MSLIPLVCVVLSPWSFVRPTDIDTGNLLSLPECPLHFAFITLY